MRSRLVRIGNSRGIRLSKPLLEQVGLVDAIEIHGQPGLLTIRPLASPRAGWAEAAASVSSQGLLDPPTETQFDQEDWDW